jgi:hypothetical protein
MLGGYRIVDARFYIGPSVVPNYLPDGSLAKNLMIWFWVCLALALLMFALLLIGALRSGEETSDWTIIAWRVVALLIAFPIWALTISGQTLDAFNLCGNCENHYHNDPTSLHLFVTVALIVAATMLPIANYAIDPKRVWQPLPSPKVVEQTPAIK